MHTTKRAVLLSCSDHYNHRLYVIDGLSLIHISEPTRRS